MKIAQMKLLWFAAIVVAVAVILAALPAIKWMMIMN
jgi:hypothetical protein